MNVSYGNTYTVIATLGERSISAYIKEVNLSCTTDGELTLQYYMGLDENETQQMCVPYKVVTYPLLVLWDVTISINNKPYQYRAGVDFTLNLHTSHMKMK